mgnify:FL=1|jgi:hypothetical protein
MNFKEAWELIGGLSKPSKMPWWSYSIPAQACKTGSKLAEIPGTVCYNCYALKGFYNMPNVKDALDRRLKAIEHPKFEEAFITVLNDLWARSKTGENRFRWHDSGDIQSLNHLTKINNIANLTPTIRHWLPTKETALVSEWKKLNGDFAFNLVVRHSHPKVGRAFHKTKKELFSTVGASQKWLKQCNAPKQKNKCMGCDHCWNPKVYGVNYKQH